MVLSIIGLSINNITNSAIIVIKIIVITFLPYKNSILYYFISE